MQGTEPGGVTATPAAFPFLSQALWPSLGFFCCNLDIANITGTWLPNAARVSHFVHSLKKMNGYLASFPHGLQAFPGLPPLTSDTRSAQLSLVRLFTASVLCS